MSEVSVYERFNDALNRRSSYLKTFPGSYDYKAGFMQSLLEQLARDIPEVRSRLVMATHMLENWADESEQDKRARDAEVDGVC